MNSDRILESELLQRICKPLLAWYKENRRQLEWRQNPLPYYVWVSEIMLQQTRVEAVKPYFERFVTELPGIRDLAECSEDRLLKLWEGLGYYSRARNLQKAARIVMEQYDGELPPDVNSLLFLPGIGSYTAGAIASIAFGIPAPAVDGNVLRVLTRIMASEDCIDDSKVKAELENRIRAFLCENSGGSSRHPEGEIRGNPNDAELCSVKEEERKNQADAGRHSEKTDIAPGDFNQALMELGAMVCLPNGVPSCGICPVRELCLARRENLIDQIPVRKKKKERRIEKKTVLVIRDSERALIRKRPAKGLLAGLWELPNYEGHLTRDAAVREAEKLGVSPVRIRPLPEARHIFSHVEWEMTGYLILAEEMDALIPRPHDLTLKRTQETKLNHTQAAAQPGQEPSRHKGQGRENRPAGPGCSVVNVSRIKEEFSIPTAFARYAAWLEEWNDRGTDWKEQYEDTDSSYSML